MENRQRRVNEMNKVMVEGTEQQETGSERLRQGKKGLRL